MEKHFNTVRELLDELLWYDLGAVSGANYYENHRCKLLEVVPIDDPFKLRVGFRVRYEDWTRDDNPVLTQDLWIKQRDAKTCGAWGRALSTVEGRSYVANHWMGSSYWSQDAPRDVQFGVVLFDP